MARNLGSLEGGAIVVAAATAETLLQLVAPTNIRVVLIGYGIGGTGTSNTETPGIVNVQRQTSAGTSSAQTPLQLQDTITEALQSTGRDLFTVEPTLGDLLRRHTVHPQAALDLRDSFSREIIIGTVGRLGISVTYAQAQTLEAYLDFEE